MDVLPAPKPLVADRYEVDRELGRGGMATVYLARDRRHDSLVALKLLHPDLAPLFAGERFAREIRIVAGLQHPHILPVLDSGQAAGVPFYTMPFVDGESLGHRLKRERQLSMTDAVHIATEVADALAYAHERGVVHRDVKPENILLSSGHAIVADFGIARAMDAAAGERITESGIAVGTATYMSPEQAAGGGVDGRSDVYALGCVLYEMLAGTPPFTGGTPQTVMARHAIDPVPSLRTVRATVSPALEHVVNTALAKVPADRYAGAAEMAAALREAERNPGTVAGADATRTRRRRATAWLLFAVVVVAGVIGTWRMIDTRGARLDPHKVTVYPFVASSAIAGSRTIGEDVATLIGNSLAGTAPLQWVDGWRLLDAKSREDMHTVEPAQLLAGARSKGSAYYLGGRIVTRGDSADVLVDLYDVAGDSVAHKGMASGPLRDVHALALRAVNGVLPALIPGSTQNLEREWVARPPLAVAQFLLGEAAFRRVRPADALAHYRSAVATDSAFTLAALRGAQAAIWSHRSTDAADFVRVALVHPLRPRDAAFAHGVEAYIAGRADSAATALRTALALDPEMASAWMQLGEVYTHLLPTQGNPDSLAQAAFSRAHELDSSATTSSFHLIERRLRRGESKAAAEMLDRFLAAAPDTMLARQLVLMRDCDERGASRMEWPRQVRQQPLAVLLAAKSLAAGGGNFACAGAAFTALVDGDTASSDPRSLDRRWSALNGLQHLLVASGRTDSAGARLDRAIATGLGGESLLLLDATLEPALRVRASAVAHRDEARFGASYARSPTTLRSWRLAAYEAAAGRGDVVAAIAEQLRAAAGRGGARADSLLARSTSALAALAQGDTASAIAQLERVVAEPVTSEQSEYDVVVPHALERLQLARLYAARGDPRRAIRVADGFESTWPLVHVLYLPYSLELRASASEALGDAASASRFRARRDALRARS